MTINELVIQYKNTKNKDILNDIFIYLKKIIKDKARFIYYQKVFNVNGKNIKLNKYKQVTVDDVEQELCVEILRLIDKCDINKPFDKYFFSSIWFWKPNFINNDFINNSSNISNYDKEDNNIFDNIVDTYNNTKVIIEDLFLKLTMKEKKLINILKENPNITQKSLAKILKVTQPRISKMFSKIRKKCK